MTIGNIKGDARSLDYGSCGPFLFKIICDLKRCTSMVASLIIWRSSMSKIARTRKSGSMLGMLDTFWGMGFLIFMYKGSFFLPRVMWGLRNGTELQDSSTFLMLDGSDQLTLEYYSRSC